MNINSILDIEKNYFSSMHSNFDRLFKNLNKKQLSNENLTKIILINKKILEINNMLEDINYNITKKRKNKSINIKKEIEEYEKNDKAIQEFLPYILYYRFLMESK